jgi:hypothetical protein
LLSPLCSPAGLKLEVLGLLNPDKGSKAALVTATYRQPAFHGRLITDVLNGPTVTADAVVGYVLLSPYFRQQIS